MGDIYQLPWDIYQFPRDNVANSIPSCWESMEPGTGLSLQQPL